MLLLSGTRATWSKRTMAATRRPQSGLMSLTRPPHGEGHETRPDRLLGRMPSRTRRPPRRYTQTRVPSLDTQLEIKVMIEDARDIGLSEPDWHALGKQASILGAGRPITLALPEGRPSGALGEAAERRGVPPRTRHCLGGHGRQEADRDVSALRSPLRPPRGAAAVIAFDRYAVGVGRRAVRHGPPR